jgi:hypothetical protein
MTASVSGISGGSRRPAAGGGVCRVTSADGGPVLTGVVRCGPVVRGPDVAPMWPGRSELGRRVRQRRSAGLLRRWAQLRESPDPPLLSVRDPSGTGAMGTWRAQLSGGTGFRRRPARVPRSALCAHRSRGRAPERWQRPAARPIRTVQKAYPPGTAGGRSKVSAPQSRHSRYSTP